jgi:hypothetical protein
MIWNFGMPQVVFSLSAGIAGDRQQRLSLTEDVAVISMKFSDRLLGNITASRNVRIGSQQNFLKVCSRDWILTVDSDTFTVYDGLGQIVSEYKYNGSTLQCMEKQLEGFALSTLSPDNNAILCSARSNLSNMAVIESAYLSFRTGMPEEPGRVFHMEQIEPINP